LIALNPGAGYPASPTIGFVGGVSDADFAPHSNDCARAGKTLHLPDDLAARSAIKAKSLASATGEIIWAFFDTPPLQEGQVTVTFYRVDSESQ
jgi:hypothetical protein